MRNDSQFDLVVIGSGAAGGAAAKAARQAGLSVALIERDRLGGDCPNHACIPTKALLRSTKVFSLIKRAEEFGLCPGRVDVDWSRVMERERKIVNSTGAATAREWYEEQGVKV